MEYADFFLFAHGMCFARAVGLLGLFFAWPLLFLSFSIQFFVKGNKTSSVKNGKKNATTLETKFNITRQFISDTGFQVKANLNMVFNIAFFPEQSYFLCIWVRCSVQSCNNGSYCKRFSQHCKVALLPEFPITLSPIEIS